MAESKIKDLFGGTTSGMAKDAAGDDHRKIDAITDAFHRTTTVEPKRGIAPSPLPAPGQPVTPGIPGTKNANAVKFEDVKGEITKSAVMDGMARDALDAVGHEMDADAFQDYVRRMSEYEAWKTTRDEARANGKVVNMEYRDPPAAPAGCQDIYDQAYADYKLRLEALDAYLDPGMDPENINGRAAGASLNPYRTKEGMAEIAKRYQAAETAVTEIAACSGGSLPCPVFGDSLAKRMGRRAEWGNAYDAVKRYCTDGHAATTPNGGILCIWGRSIDCSGVEISDERRAEIEATCPSNMEIPPERTPRTTIIADRAKDAQKLIRDIQNDGAGMDGMDKN